MLRSRHHYVAWSQSSPAAVTAVILLLVASLTGHGQAVVASRSRRLARQVIVSRHNGHGTGYGLQQQQQQQQPDSNQVHAVAYLGFCEGGARAKDARFEAPEAPMGWSVGRGCPLPIEEIFKFFLVQCAQKIFVFRPKGGGIAQCPPP